MVSEHVQRHQQMRQEIAELVLQRSQLQQVHCHYHGSIQLHVSKFGISVSKFLCIYEVVLHFFSLRDDKPTIV